MWERACSRIRSISLHMHQLTHRFREQARSHTFNPGYPDISVRISRSPAAPSAADAAPPAL
ncbi:hypothetical protein FRT60_14010 [Pseudomonas haemolytica]|uniref:Uncharacterized protein n=1 Tax=Pseudomonas haemolytica TaxID=2600065 RepID=A0A646P1F5_9PSED|nr:hypothetical protein [Pseudomonas haemolytica]